MALGDTDSTRGNGPKKWALSEEETGGTKIRMDFHENDSTQGLQGEHPSGEFMVSQSFLPILIYEVLILPICH